MNKTTIIKQELYKILSETLYKQKIISSIKKGAEFWDYPRVYQYNALLELVDSYTDGIRMPQHLLSAYGTSLESPYNALIKCVGECLERFCQYCYSQKNIQITSFRKLKESAFDLTQLIADDSFKDYPLGWVNGYRVSHGTNPSLIPAQLVYLNYLRQEAEADLPFPNISTGAAGGFSHDFTLLGGIYEIIERDSFMCIYLNKLPAPRLNLDTIESKKIQSLLEYLRRYKIELNVFNIETDLEIPAYLSIATDRTGIGKPIACGLKAGLNIENTLLGSIEESFMILNALRMRSAHSHATVSSKSLFKKMKFLLDQKPIPFKLNTYKGTIKDELTTVIQALTKKNHNIFYADITIPDIKKLEYYVYKAIIPSLQPLFKDDSTKKIINFKRLNHISKYFGKKRFSINQDPHPFL